MKSIIETELPSSTGLYTGGAELLELKYCVINTYMTGLEVDNIVLSTYLDVLDTDTPSICSLSEIITGIHYIDLAVYNMGQAGVSLNYLCSDKLFYKHYNNYREALYEALLTGNYADSTFISDYELNALKRPSKYVLENSFVDCDFTFAAFEKAFKFNKKLIKHGVRDKSTSITSILSNLREDLYAGGDLKVLDTKAGRKFIKSMEQKQS